MWPALLFTDSPVVTLELGSNLNGSSIREGMDVYFECNILANPWVYKVIWRHNVSICMKLVIIIRDFLTLTNKCCR
jgi:hypothetical protein